MILGYWLLFKFCLALQYESNHVSHIRIRRSWKFLKKKFCQKQNFWKTNFEKKIFAKKNLEKILKKKNFEKKIFGKKILKKKILKKIFEKKNFRNFFPCPPLWLLQLLPLLPPLNPLLLIPFSTHTFSIHKTWPPHKPQLIPLWKSKYQKLIFHPLKSTT